MNEYEERENQVKPVVKRTAATPGEESGQQKVRFIGTDDCVKKFVFIYISISIILSFIIAITLAFLTPITKSRFCKGLCLNGGSCQKTTCSCPSGWTGDYCGYDVDECQGNNDRCLNGGTCANTIGSYVCVCTSSFMDYKCNTSVDDCLAFSSLCHNGGQCVDTASSYYCVCRAGYGGNDCSSLWQAMFSVSTSQPQVYTTNGTEWHISFDRVYINTVDMYNKWSSSVFIPTNGIYYFYYTIGLGNGSSASVKLNYLPHSGPIQPLFRNGSIFTSQTSLMTFSDIRQLNKSTTAFLSSEYPVDIDRQTAVTWGGFRIDDVSKPLIVFSVFGANAIFFGNFLYTTSYYINFTMFALDTASAWSFSSIFNASLFTAPIDGIYVFSFSILGTTNDMGIDPFSVLIRSIASNVEVAFTWSHTSLWDSYGKLFIVELDKGSIVTFSCTIQSTSQLEFSQSDLMIKGFYYGPSLPVVWYVTISLLHVPYIFEKQTAFKNIFFSESSLGVQYSGYYFVNLDIIVQAKQTKQVMQLLINRTLPFCTFATNFANYVTYSGYPMIVALSAGDQLSFSGNAALNADVSFLGFLLYPH